MNSLGFGMMRLPVKDGNPTDFDYDELNSMVDRFLEAGFTYFDTSFVYHEGESEHAVHEALVARHPRDSYTIATKFPTFNNVPESEIEATFQTQLDRLGVDFIDYYLIHNIQTVYYDGIDGAGGIVASTHLFDHAKQWKAEGRIHHLGISFHSSAAVLDRVLAEHPEVEFVQLAINPIDWASEFVQAAACYEVVRRHGRQVIVMEPVKGGGLATLPEEAEALLHSLRPDASMASWAVRFAMELQDVITVLSGMSTLEQMNDNIATVQAAEPFSHAERRALWQAMDLYRASTPITPADLESYRGLYWNGVPVTAILQAYSICQIQPDPGFSDDNNYFKNALAENSHLDLFGELPRPQVILPTGEDKTDLVNEAVDWLIDNSF